MKTTKILTEVKNGDLFKIADIEFIKFGEKDGVTYAVAKKEAFESKFGLCNNYADVNNIIRKRLETEILPKIEEAVGAENVLEFETDLLSLDGDNAYGKYRSKISLPTFDFYRAYVDIFDKYKLDKWWWLTTPFSTKKHLNDYWVNCVSPSGIVSSNGYYGDSGGVRPILNFVSSISVSCDE